MGSTSGARDQSGNLPEATLGNARREGVADRVEVRTADVRSLPFPDRSFTSSFRTWSFTIWEALPDRAQAIKEIARVLKPSGQALIADIRHGRAYAATFAECGCPDVPAI